MNKFVTKDLISENILKNMSSRKDDMYYILKQLGNFGEEIEVVYNKNKYYHMGLTAVDNNGDKYTFEGSNLGKLYEVMFERQDGLKIFVYRTIINCKDESLKVIPRSLSEKLENGYFYEKQLGVNNGFPIKRSIKKGDLEYDFTTSSLYEFNEDLFKSQVETSESISFMEFVELVKHNLNHSENNVAFLTFTVRKDGKEIGRIVIENGNFTSFSLTEEQNNQLLTITLEDGDLIEKSTITIDTTTSSLPESLARTIEKARRLVKGQ